MLGIRKKTVGPSDAQTQADVAGFRTALAMRGLKGRDGDEWISDVFEMAGDEAARPSDAYLSFVMSEEGVTQDDANWYWSLGPHIRAFFKHLDNLDHMGLFIGLQREMSAEAAGVKVHQMHPYYGDPRPPALSTQGHKDRMVPWELKDRVDLYIERRARQGLDAYKRDLDESSSFNALVRAEMEAGQI